MSAESFKKAERLSSKKTIEGLFSRGKSSFNYPIKFVWLQIADDSPFPVKVLVTASKKKVRKAVERNKVKRRLREAYRRNKTPLFESLMKTNRKLALGIIYLGKNTGNYEEIEQKIIELITRLIEDNEKYSG